MLVLEERDTRENLATALIRDAGLSCASFGTGEQALDFVYQCSVDVALVGLNLPTISGIECTRRLKSIVPRLDVIVAYPEGQSGKVFDAFRAGATGFVAMDAEPGALLQAIHEVLGGGVPISRKAARRLVQHFQPAKPKPVSKEALSGREEEILKCLVQGYVTKEIARELSVSYNTVRTHLKHIYGKLQVRSRTEAVIKHLNGAA